MKFSKQIEEIKNEEENKGKIVLIRCGIFFIATGNDAILLNKLYGLKVICFKEGVCKVGIPVSFALKYLEMLEKDQYGYILYDYEKETKQLIPQYKYEGNANPEENMCKDCVECPHYNTSCIYSNTNIYELIELRKRKAESDGKE